MIPLKTYERRRIKTPHKPLQQDVLPNGLNHEDADGINRAEESEEEHA